MRLPRPLAATLTALSLGFLLGADGCSEYPMACTMIGCSDAYVVALAAEDGTLPAGRYEVRVTSQDERRSCAFTASRSEAGASFTDTTADCRGVYDRASGGRVDVVFEPLGGSIAVEVLRNGAVVAEDVDVPAYEPQYPNGVDCGAVCEVARTEVAVE